MAKEKKQIRDKDIETARRNAMPKGSDKEQGVSGAVNATRAKFHNQSSTPFYQLHNAPNGTVQANNSKMGDEIFDYSVFSKRDLLQGLKEVFPEGVKSQNLKGLSADMLASVLKQVILNAQARESFKKQALKTMSEGDLRAELAQKLEGGAIAPEALENMSYDTLSTIYADERVKQLIAQNKEDQIRDDSTDGDAAYINKGASDKISLPTFGEVTPDEANKFFNTAKVARGYRVNDSTGNSDSDLEDERKFLAENLNRVEDELEYQREAGNTSAVMELVKERKELDYRLGEIVGKLQDNRTSPQEDTMYSFHFADSPAGETLKSGMTKEVDEWIKHRIATQAPNNPWWDDEESMKEVIGNIREQAKSVHEYQEGIKALEDKWVAEQQKQLGDVGNKFKGSLLEQFSDNWLRKYAPDLYGSQDARDDLEGISAIAQLPSAVNQVEKPIGTLDVRQALEELYRDYPMVGEAVDKDLEKNYMTKYASGDSLSREEMNKGKDKEYLDAFEGSSNVQLPEVDPTEVLARREAIANTEDKADPTQEDVLPKLEKAALGQNISNPVEVEAPEVDTPVEEDAADAIEQYRKSVNPTDLASAEEAPSLTDNITEEHIASAKNPKDKKELMGEARRSQQAEVNDQEEQTMQSAMNKEEDKNYLDGVMLSTRYSDKPEALKKKLVKAAREYRRIRDNTEMDALTKNRELSKLKSLIKGMNGVSKGRSGQLVDPTSGEAKGLIKRKEDSDKERSQLGMITSKDAELFAEDSKNTINKAAEEFNQKQDNSSPEGVKSSLAKDKIIVPRKSKGAPVGEVTEEGRKVLSDSRFKHILKAVSSFGGWR